MTARTSKITEIYVPCTEEGEGIGYHLRNNYLVTRELAWGELQQGRVKSIMYLRAGKFHVLVEHPEHPTEHPELWWDVDDIIVLKD